MAPVLTAAPSPAITPQPNNPPPRVSLRINLGALPLMDQGLIGERTDTQGRRQLGAVGQRHLLGGVMGIEAVPRAATLTRPALTTHRTPIQDHEITRHDIGHAGTNRLHRARGLMAQQERILVVDTALAISQIGMTHTARHHRDHHLTRPRIGNDDVDQLNRLL
ncbi:hypothetical protein MHEL_00070 [Mycolicibacterium helvum]|uniref:Uncharacterized protein n=1 Tax=Mycolicibacterium helvum TaxID=1534349 RepID=A0A7I7SXK6_9MYCO|nr:hypothetical protein MHEL_00070 [Mycolicibacterium helvum]